MSKFESNLDKVSAEIGFDLAESFKDKEDAKKLETIVTKALGVLIEDGLFAYAIWLESRSKTEKNYTAKIIEKSLDLIRDRVNITSKNSLIDATLEISENIQKTLLARQLLERMLVYARYRAKAIQNGSD
jgi:hypothetical protein